jgi:hypothetical protein
MMSGIIAMDDILMFSITRGRSRWTATSRRSPRSALAERYRALVMVDDSHARGFFGPTGRSTHEHCGVAGRVDIITSPLGKALAGASGGFTAAQRDVIDLLRQRSRPYLFSNTLAPALVSASSRVSSCSRAPPRIAIGWPPTRTGSGRR